MKIILKTKKKIELIDLTEKIINEIKNYKVNEGICIIQTMHTTTSLYLNENEPKINQDFIEFIKKFAYEKKYLHDVIDNNGAAHIVSNLMPSSLNIIIEKGKLLLGKWQRILFLELDGPRKERVLNIKIINGEKYEK